MGPLLTMALLDGSLGCAQTLLCIWSVAKQRLEIVKTFQIQTKIKQGKARSVQSNKLVIHVVIREMGTVKNSLVQRQAASAS